MGFPGTQIASSEPTGFMPASAGGDVTVVMPTYNHGHYITDALDSLFAQTRVPERVLILDDASTDNTTDIVRPYLGRVPRVDYVRMPHNRGVVEMLNVGLDEIDTEYVVFLAADDMLDAAALETCTTVMNRYPQAPVCGVLARYVAEDKRPLPTPGLFDFGPEARYMAPDECLKRLHRQGALFGGNGAMYRVKPLRSHGGFTRALRSFCDGFRIQELALAAGACVVPQVLASWRQSTTTYAAVHRADPAGALAITDAVDTELKRDGSPFPPRYAARLRRRLRFAAAQAAVQSRPVDASALRRALSGYPEAAAALIAFGARIVGPRAAVAALALLLRPFDIPRAFRPRKTLTT